MRSTKIKMKIPHTHFMDCLALSFSPSDLQLTACTHAPKAGLKSKDRQEATVLSNFDQLTRCDARIEDMHRSLMKIFTSGSDGVYSA